MHDSPITIVPLNASHLPSLCQLYQQVWHRSLEPAYFHWLYLEHPLHHRYALPLVAQDRQTVVGMLGGLPVDMRVHDRTLTAYQFSTGMVTREYTRLGVFNQLYQAYLARFAESRLDLLMGFCNQLLCNYYRKHEPRTQVLGNSPLHIRVLDSRPFLTRRHKALAPLAAPVNLGIRLLEALVMPHSPQLTDISESDWPSALMEERNRPESAIYPLKDTAWYRWRYQGYLKPHYRILALPEQRGIAIIRPEVKEQRLLLMDILNCAREPESQKQLLQGVLRYARDAGLASVHAWAIPGGAMAAALRRLGFLFHPERKNFLIAANLSEVVENPELFATENWEISLGDGDRA